MSIPKTKFAGLTSDEWKELNNQPYILINVTKEVETYSLHFLDAFIDECNEFEYIVLLEPDPKNMTRTNINIPDGIEVEATTKDSGKFLTITPVSNKLKEIIKHYRILGVLE